MADGYRGRRRDGPADGRAELCDARADLSHASADVPDRGADGLPDLCDAAAIVPTDVRLRRFRSSVTCR